MPHTSSVPSVDAPEAPAEPARQWGRWWLASTAMAVVLGCTLAWALAVLR